MRLSELEAHVTGTSDGRKGVGLIFQCPLCAKEGRPRGARQLIIVHFKNPLDGGEPLKGTTWTRTGETLETFTLDPSINAEAQDHGSHRGWHGHIRNGAVEGGGV